jgi:hypothetical protein
LWPGDAACCLLASLASRGRQAVSQPCRRTVSDHAWLVLDSSCQCDMTGGMHPVRNHTPLSSRNGVPDQATRSPSSLRLREPTLHTHAIPCVREGREKLCKSMDDGCGAGTIGTMTSTLWGWMAMQLATAAQRCKNLDTIHGAKREECSGFPTVRGNTNSSYGALKVQ